MQYIHSGTVYQVTPEWCSWEPCTHRLGPYWKLRPNFLAEWTQIGDKPRLETCVVSQVVADTLARLPLEGCRGAFLRAHGDKWRERV